MSHSLRINTVKLIEPIHTIEIMPAMSWDELNSLREPFKLNQARRRVDRAIAGVLDWPMANIVSQTSDQTVLGFLDRCFDYVEEESIDEISANLARQIGGTVCVVDSANQKHELAS